MTDYSILDSWDNVTPNSPEPTSIIKSIEADLGRSLTPAERAKLSSDFDADGEFTFAMPQKGAMEVATPSGIDPFEEIAQAKRNPPEAPILPVATPTSPVGEYWNDVKANAEAELEQLKNMGKNLFAQAGASWNSDTLFETDADLGAEKAVQEETRWRTFNNIDQNQFGPKRKLAPEQTEEIKTRLQAEQAKELPELRKSIAEDTATAKEAEAALGGPNSLASRLSRVVGGNILNVPKQVLPIAGSVGGGIVGAGMGAEGGPLGAAAGASVGSRLGAAVGSTPLAQDAYYAGRYEAIHSFGATEEEAQAYGTAMAAIEAGVEALGGPIVAKSIGLLGIKKLTKDGAKEALARTMASRGAKIAGAVAVETAEEVVTEGLNDAMLAGMEATNVLSGKDSREKLAKYNEERFENPASRYTDVALGGAMFGGVIGAPTVAYTHAAEVKAANTDRVNKSLENTFNHLVGVTTERENQAQEQAAAQQQADEAEAAKRTVERQQAANEYQERTGIKIAAIKPVTAAQVKAEREQAAQAKAAPVEPVAVGQEGQQLPVQPAVRRKRGKKAVEAGVSPGAKLTEDPTKKQQLGRIHKAKKALGLDDAGYRKLLVDTTGVSSSAAMTNDQRNAVLAAMQERGANTGPVALTAPGATQAATATKTDAELEDADTRALAEQAGLKVAKVNETLGMKGKPKVKIPSDFVPKVQAIFKELIRRNTQQTADVQNIILQDKLVLVPNAASVNRPDLGNRAEYDTETGQMYVYTDNMDAKDIVSNMIEAMAAHEGTHAGQDSGREGRGVVLSELMSKEENNKINTKIREQAAKDTAAGKKTAYTEAVKQAIAAAGGDKNIETLEVAGYFVSEVLERRNNQRIIGAALTTAKDIRAAVRGMVREKLKLDLDITLEEIEAATTKVVGEIVATNTKTDGSKKGTLGMIGGQQGANFDKADFIYRGVVDGKLRYEFSDEEAGIEMEAVDGFDAFSEGKRVALDKILHHPELYENYPQLSTLPIFVDPKLAGTTTKGIFYGLGKGIAINPDIIYLGSDMLSTVLHEVQHAVQRVEGFVPGANSKYLIDPRLKPAEEEAQKTYDSTLSKFEYGAAVKSLPTHIREKWAAFTSRPKPEGWNTEANEVSFLRGPFADEVTDRNVKEQIKNYKWADKQRKETKDALRKAETEAFKLYIRDYGEAEARNTEYRRKMTKAQRDAERPESTMVKAREKVPVEETLDTRTAAKAGSEQFGTANEEPTPTHEIVEVKTGKVVAQVSSLQEAIDKVEELGGGDKYWAKKIRPTPSATTLGMAKRNTDTKEFKNWFGDSKVTDSSGDPKVMYHGTTNDVGNFDLAKAGSKTDSGWLGKGFYFTDEPVIADYYAARGDGENPNVMPVYLSLQNPYMWGRKTTGIRGEILKGKGLPADIRQAVLDRANFKFDPNVEPDFRQEKVLSQALTDELISRGHDGVVAITGLTPEDSVQEVVAFNGEQIKSVFNSGAYGKNTNVLGMAARPKEQTPKEALSTKETLRRILDHGTRTQTADIKFAEDLDTQYRRAISIDMKGRTDLDAINEEILSKLTAVDNADGEARKKLWANFKKKYPNLAPVLETMRDTIDGSSREYISTLLNSGRILSKKENKDIRTLLAQEGKYLTRAYSAFQQKVGRPWAENRWNDYKTKLKSYMDIPPGLSRRARRKAEQVKKNVEAVLDAIKFIESQIVIPDNDKLIAMKTEKLERLYELHLGTVNRLDYRHDSKDPLAARRAALVEGLIERRESLPPGHYNTAAEQTVKELLGLEEKTSSYSRVFADLARDPGTLKKKEHIPQEIRTLLGEITNPGGVVLATLSSQAALNARARVIFELLTKENGNLVIPASRINEPGMREKFPQQLNGQQYGQLEGFYATKNTAAALTDTLSAYYSYNEALARFRQQPSILLKKAISDALKKGVAKVTRFEKIVGVVLKPYNWAGNVLGSPINMLRSGNFSGRAALKGLKTGRDYVYGTAGNTTTALLEDAIRYVNIEAVDVAEMQRVLGDKIGNYMDGKITSEDVEDFIKDKIPLTKLARRVGRTTVATYAMLDAWVKVANFYDRLDTMSKYYQLTGAEITLEEIKREAGDVTSYTNLSNERVPNWLKLPEQHGLTKFIPYFSETLRTTWTNYAQGLLDLKRASETQNPEAAAVLRSAAARRIIGNTLATVVMPIQFPLLTNSALALMGISAFALAGDDDDDRIKRRMLSAFNRYQDMIQFGVDKDGNPIFLPISMRFDPNGPATDLFRIFANAETDQEVYDGVKNYLQELWITPTWLSHTIASATRDTVPQSKIAANFPAMTDAVSDFVSSIPLVGASRVTVNKALYDIESLVPFLNILGLPKYKVALPEDAPVARVVAIKALEGLGASFETLKPERALVAFGMEAEDASRSNRATLADEILLRSETDEDSIINAIAKYRSNEKDRYLIGRQSYESLRAWGYDDAKIKGMLTDAHWDKREAEDIIAGDDTSILSLRSLSDSKRGKEDEAKLKEVLDIIRNNKSELEEMGIEVRKD